MIPLELAEGYRMDEASSSQTKASSAEFFVQGDDSSVTIRISSRCHPTLDYWDGNWLYTHVEVKLPGFHVSFTDCCLRADELGDFLGQLERFYKTLTGSAELNSMEGAIYLQAESDRLGHIYWKGHTTYPIGERNTLTFRFASDQSYLPNLIQGLNDVLKTFPVVGKR
jgi:hypothetical protein